MMPPIAGSHPSTINVEVKKLPRMQKVAGERTPVAVRERRQVTWREKPILVRPGKKHVDYEEHTELHNGKVKDPPAREESVQGV